MTDTVVDDLVAEAVRLDSILSLLTEAQWLADSAADGWSVADVVLHLAQGDEGVAASAGGTGPRAGAAADVTVDEWAARMVEAERAAPGGGLPPVAAEPRRRGSGPAGRRSPDSRCSGWPGR